MLSITLATYPFEKEAELWWGTVKPRVGEPLLTCNQIKELMDAKYYPIDMKKAKKQNFYVQSKRT